MLLDRYNDHVNNDVDPLKEMYSRLTAEFSKHVEDEDLDVSDEEDFFFEFESFLYDEYTIRVGDNGVIEFYKLDDKQQYIIGDLPVVLYHVTSSVLMDSIKEKGLVPGQHKTNPHGNSYSGVYLTTETTGPAINGYKYHAYNKHGGDTILISVKCYLNELTPDPDDQDISSGETQFIIDHVPPERIIEIDTIY